jgi:hypothetical protein
MKRRQFLKSLCDTALGATAFPYIVPSSVFGANGAVPPGEKIVMGFIGVGSMGGLGGAWGIHPIDIARWGNGTDFTGPVEIQGSGIIPADGIADTPIEWDVEHLYANGVKMIHTNTRTALKRAEQFSLHNGLGILFIGDEGRVLVEREFIDAEPKSLLTATIGPDEIRLPRSNNHRRNFIESVKSRQQTICPVGIGVRSDTICHLDDIAIRLGRKLH